jgi:hypothetical protein
MPNVSIMKIFHALEELRDLADKCVGGEITPTVFVERGKEHWNFLESNKSSSMFLLISPEWVRE